jgi:hypothetical protein
MNITEFKKQVLTYVTFSTKKEKERVFETTNKSLSGISLKNLKTPDDVRSAWIRYNKLQEEWEEIDRRLAKTLNKSTGYIDFSHLAYNGVTDDF